MQFASFVQTQEDFDKWLNEQRMAPRCPTTPDAIAGKQVFFANSCAGNSAIKIDGTVAMGVFRPDLTHFCHSHDARFGIVPNTQEKRPRMRRDPSHVKPASSCRTSNLPKRRWEQVSAYLETSNSHGSRNHSAGRLQSRKHLPNPRGKGLRSHGSFRTSSSQSITRSSAYVYRLGPVLLRRRGHHGDVIRIHLAIPNNHFLRSRTSFNRFFHDVMAPRW